ncbi:MAG: tRNA pseudouridine(38-40) synthase TruA [Anaerolineales bacterium]|nr:tRNA pseudouridine(38-40) synthase TruA [Anaerolineales bacterium]
MNKAMARYQVILAYDGTGFTGSQKQASSRTVQGELERALYNLGWSGKSVIMAGRTDTGVHATGQVAAFDFEWTHSADKLLRALNADLPSDLVISSLLPASADSHPRFDAVSRRYRYRLICKQIRDPLRDKFVWRVWPEMDADILKQNASIFLGTHDFAAIGSPTTPKGTTVRTVTKAEWKKMPDGEWQFEVQADAFLYRMVRRMVFVQVSVAQGKCSVEKVQHALSKQGKLLAGLAPAHGLTLVEVQYGSRD